MSPRTVEQTPALVTAILAGEHDADLSHIQWACATRLKRQFRKRQQVKLTGTKSVELEGKTGVVIAVNQKTITVGVGKATTDEWGTTYEHGTFRVPPSMLTAVES